MADPGLIVRVARAVLLRALPLWARDAARGDLDEELGRITRERGRAAATWWYVREALVLGVRYAAERRHGPPQAGVILEAGQVEPPTTSEGVLNFVRDLRFTVRQIGAKPAFWLAATVTLGVAIGFNAAIFSLVNAVLFRPLAAANPERVVRFYAQADRRAPSAAFSYLDYRALSQHDGSVTQMSAVHLATVLMADGTRTDQLLGEIASGSYFELLGVPVIAGRRIAPADDRRSSPPAALLSEHHWRNRFGGDPGVIGRSVRMSGRPFTIVGIVGSRFGGSFIGGGVDVWLPLEAGLPLLGAEVVTDGTQQPLQILARLRDEVSPAQAAASLEPASADIARNRKVTGGVRLELVPGTLLHGNNRRMAARFLSLLTAMVALVLLVAASNVANLQLARTLARRREIAIRLSLGAGRLRIIQQLIAESMVLAAGGLLIASAIAIWVSAAFRSVEILPGFDLRLDLAPDARVFAATAAVALMAGLIATLVPALTAARGDLVPFLREGAGSMGGRRTASVRAALVVVQVGIAVVVCVAAGLLARSGRAAAAIDLGFDRAGIFATDIDLDTLGYTRPRAEAFYRTLLARLSQTPGIERVALASRAPLDSSTPVVRLLRDGDAAMSPGSEIETTYYVVTPDYLATVGVPLLAGRSLSESDRAAAPHTAVANDFLVQALWPGLPSSQAIGRRVRVKPSGSGGSTLAGEIEIVGIARNAKYRSVGEASQPHLYVPFAQHHAASMALLVRSPTRPLPVREVQAEVAALDPAVQGFFTRTLDEHTSVALLPARLASRVSAAVGIVAAMLGALGLHALVTCVVAERRREFGLRMALGASAGRVSGDVIRQALWLALAGCGAGTVVALSGARLLNAFLYGVSPFDPVVYGAVIAGCAAGAAMSAWIPARRAAHIDPTTALRQ